MKRAFLTILLVASPYLVAGKISETEAAEACYTELPPCDYAYTLPYYDLQCTYGITVSIDFLYWLGKETNLAYAQKTKSLFYEETQNGRPTGLGQLVLTPNETKYLKQNGNLVFEEDSG